MKLFKGTISKRRTARLKKSGRYSKVVNRRKKVNNAVQKVVDTAKKVGTFAVLAPYRGLMSNALRKRGYSVPSELNDLVKEFYFKIVKRNSFDEYQYFNDGDMYAHQSTLEERNAENAIGISIAAIVSGVLSFINGIKDKKEEGQELTPTQEIILRESEKVEREVNNVKADATTATIGEMVQDYWWVGVLAVVGIVLLVKKK
jgi:hypothetical protein